MKIRKAEPRDIKNTYLLFADQTIRLKSKKSAIIKFEDHETWFNERILYDNFFILEEEHGDFIGQIRIDKKNNENIISIGLVEHYRNKGYGFKSIKECLQLINEVEIVAYIKSSNVASIRLFRKLNFVKTSVSERGGDGLERHVLFRKISQKCKESR
ncbi:MAG: GNAT family N-acetyltransferase [Holosporaceae bacterium]|jgi:RimJ/RimL family protein N-acetyltransferase|nr:GNAT family N-acetyltransferase [Holosporaceae bacterium]